MNDRLGFYISSNPIDLWDEWGYCHKGVALYELIEEPKKGGQHLQNIAALIEQGQR